MTATRPALLTLTSLTMLLAACGDDLESRQAAADAQIGEREVTLEPRPAPSPEATTIVEMDDEVEAEEADDSEEVFVDASPDDLVDSAQGFSAAPMDDASGLDPTPMGRETFDD